MLSRGFIFALVIGLVLGCMHTKPKNVEVINQVTAPYDQFIARNFDWSSVQRIVVMPFANQTPYPTVVRELRANLAAELQRAGRFDVVIASYEDHGALAHDVFANGQFNELDMLQIARDHQADAVLFANVTQYHPYARPRIGLSMLIISPAEGIAIASMSGLWDAREASTSLQAAAYFKQTQAWPKSLLGVERVFESPDVFQRFVCQQIGVSLYPPASGMAGPAGSMIPTEMVLPAAGMMPELMDVPPTPPASMGMP